MMLFVCYPRCGTCKKAEKWLTENDVSFEKRDISVDNPTVEELREWHAKSGLPLRRFFNTSGKLYREMGLKDKLKEMSEDEMFDVLGSDGLLVKRPIAVEGDTVKVGFKEAEYKVFRN